MAKIYEISKISARLGNGFVDIIPVWQKINQKSYCAPDRYLTKDLLQTTEFPNLTPTNLMYYSKQYTEYEAVVHLDNGVDASSLLAAEYISVLFADGTPIEHIAAQSIEAEENIAQSGVAKIRFTFREIVDLQQKENSYLTYPEIENVPLNKLQYYKSPLYDDFDQLINEGKTYISIFENSDMLANNNYNLLLDTGDRVLATFISFDEGVLTFEITGEYTITSFNVVYYIYTKVLHSIDVIPGEKMEITDNGIKYLTKNIDYRVLINRFYLKLAQKSDIQVHFNRNFAELIYIDYQGNEFPAITNFDFKPEPLPEIKDLFLFEMELPYEAIIREGI